MLEQISPIGVDDQASVLLARFVEVHMVAVIRQAALESQKCRRIMRKVITPGISLIHIKLSSKFSWPQLLNDQDIPRTFHIQKAKSQVDSTIRLRVDAMDALRREVKGCISAVLAHATQIAAQQGSSSIKECHMHQALHSILPLHNCDH
jgi:histone H3/H4